MTTSLFGNFWQECECHVVLREGGRQLGGVINCTVFSSKNEPKVFFGSWDREERGLPTQSYDHVEEARIPRSQTIPDLLTSRSAKASHGYGGSRFIVASVGSKNKYLLIKEPSYFDLAPACRSHLQEAPR